VLRRNFNVLALIRYSSWASLHDSKVRSKGVDNISNLLSDTHGHILPCSTFYVLRTPFLQLILPGCQYSLSHNDGPNSVVIFIRFVVRYPYNSGHPLTMTFFLLSHLYLSRATIAGLEGLTISAIFIPCRKECNNKWVVGGYITQGCTYIHRMPSSILCTTLRTAHSISKVCLLLATN